MGTPETLVKKRVKEYLKEWKCYIFMPVPTGYGKRTVDFLVCKGGRFIGIEAKAPGEKPTPLQLLTLSQIKQAGGQSFIVTLDKLDKDGKLIWTEL
jgi:hypothetical protein